MPLLRKRMSDLIAHEVNGEVLLLDSESQQLHQLNPTASFIWHSCDSVDSPEEMAALLVQEFGIDETTAMNDVLDLLSKLRALRLAEDA
jgi:hypothetical protein